MPYIKFNYSKVVILLCFAFSLPIYGVEDKHNIDFSEKEREWIKENPIVRFTGDPNWLPFEAFNEAGQYVGIVAEHLEIISKHTGIKFEKIVTKNWTESTNMAKNKKVSILSETDDSSLASHLNFTNSYFTNSIVIAMRIENNYTENINKIKDKKIGLIKDYGYATKIRNKYSSINFTTVEDINDGLTAVSTGRVDALLCTLALCSYTIAKMGISNVKITGKTEFETKLAFGIQKDLPQLLSIFNKSIKHITKGEQQEILEKWIHNKYIEEADYTFAYQTIGATLLLTIFVIGWNRRLSFEVTARKKAEEELGELLKGQRKTIELLFNNSPFGFAFCDMDGNFIDTNKEFTVITGYDLNEVKKLTYWELTPAKYKDQETAQLMSLENGGAYGPYRKEYIRKDGSIIPVELNGFLIENYNGIKGIFSLVEDISEKLAADEKFEIQRKKIIHSRKLASIGEMAAGMAHEINNPLEICNCNMTLIKKYLERNNHYNEDTKRYLENLSYANERIKKIVSGLKIYSRLDSIEYVPVSITKTIEQTLNLIDEIYEKDGIKVTFEKKKEDLHINGSLGELQQIIVNLISNAKDATEGKTVREIHITVDESQEKAHITITDNGSGISEEIKEHIFDPFFTTKEIGKGTGLGLGLVHELVTKINGEVSVESTLNKGSTFKVSIPVHYS